MIQVAEIRARQGKPDEAAEALKTALIDGRPAIPQNFFDAAQSLESWGFLAQARDFAQQGVDAAGDDLLANPANHAGAQLYVRILTRLRQQQAAYAWLETALNTAQRPAAFIPSTVRQVEKQGFAAVTDSEWRKRGQLERSSAGEQGMDACMKEMGDTVARYFAPEETSAFSQFLSSRQNGAPSDYLIDAAEAAHLSDLEIRWRYEALLASPSNPFGHLQRLIQLQSERLKYSELAGQLEKYAGVVIWNSRSYVLTSAANAYRSAGDPVDELRIYSELASSETYYQDEQRYFELLFELQREKIVELAGNSRGPWYDAATNFAVASGDDKLAYAAIRAHGTAQPPVWTKAYTSLAGLFFDDHSADVNASFQDILDDRPIGERLGKTLDLNQQLAGDSWFYYGSRYGEYLGATHQGNPEDYLPAVLEQSPGNADAYLTTAEYYADAGEYSHAIADYQHSLDLRPDQPGVCDRIAILDWKSGRRPQAIAEWNRAFEILRKQADKPSAPESFRSDFVAIAEHLGQRKLAAEFRPDMDALLRGYIRRNDSYNVMPLLHAAYSFLGDPTAATAWLLDLSSAQTAPGTILSQLVDANWIPLPQREPIYQRIMDLQESAVERSEGDEKENAQNELRRWQVRWLNYLLEAKQFQRAKDALDALPEDTRNLSAADLKPIELRIAAELNTLDSLLDAYRADPDHAPDFALLSAAASALENAHQDPAARKILEFAYSREIARHNLTATNFLGLAEIRLDSGDTKGALDLLNRLVLVVGQPFENLDAAAALLEKSHHPAEAAVFLAQLVRATPWGPEYRLRLARAQISADNEAAGPRKELAEIASAEDVPYALRVEAATAFAGKSPNRNLGSEELNLLAAGRPLPVKQANQPYFTRARVLAASEIRDDRERIALLRATLEDDPSADAARIQLLHAATAVHEYQLAYSVAEPILQSLQLGTASSPLDQAGDEIPNAAFTPELDALSHAERLRIAGELATVMENLDRLDDAVRYLQAAQDLELDPARRAEIQRHLARVRAEITRRATNAARQPQIHQQLEQDRIVRPRLLAASPTPSAAPRDSQARAEGSQP